MSFADLMATANASILNTLADVQVLIGADTVPGMFNDPSTATALGIGTADSSPSVRIASGVVPDDPVGQVVEVDGVPYTILTADPDGTGWTLLKLERTQ